MDKRPAPMPIDDEFDPRYVELARRILEECRVSLMMSFRFLDRALWKMPLIPRRLRQPLATDCHALYFDPVGIIESFRLEPNAVTRMLLHSILHCVFRHPLRTERRDPGIWSLSCDICIEAIALEMSEGKLPLARDGQAVPILVQLEAELGGNTPMKTYRFIQALMLDPHPRRTRLSLPLLLQAKEAFELDSHELWQLERRQDQDDEGNAGDTGEQEGEDGQDDETQDDAEGEQDERQGSTDDVSYRSGKEGAESPESEESPEGSNKHDRTEGTKDKQGSDQSSSQDEASEEPDESQGASESEESSESDEQSGMGSGAGQGSGDSYTYTEGELGEAADSDDEREWEQIAQQVQVDLQTLSKKRGDGAGTMMANLELANRSAIDYADFLRRFATPKEELALNDEEFDYIFYTYGIDHYGNVPLIEPLEYKDTNRVREFVIAVDTSGSCSGELVRIFLTRTYEILSQTSEFGARVNVHIIQCDAEIQSDDKIENIQQFREFEKGFEVRGMGGTDFRPVFAYVNELIAQGEFEDLRGLIYFTDGFGVFPTRKPDYDTAFVFVEEEGKSRRVPPWAMKVVLEQDQIMDMQAQI